nr:hypothetical protein JVH1_0021 [Rhodococcus sp. JVH1]
MYVIVDVDVGRGVPTPLSQGGHRSAGPLAEQRGHLVRGSRRLEHRPHLGRVGPVRWSEDRQAADVHRMRTGFAEEEQRIGRTSAAAWEVSFRLSGSSIRTATAGTSGAERSAPGNRVVR